jgi:hypothetical protein
MLVHRVTSAETADKSSLPRGSESKTEDCPLAALKQECVHVFAVNMRDILDLCIFKLIGMSHTTPRRFAYKGTRLNVARIV